MKHIYCLIIDYTEASVYVWQLYEIHQTLFSFLQMTRSLWRISLHVIELLRTKPLVQMRSEYFRETSLTRFGFALLWTLFPPCLIAQGTDLTLNQIEIPVRRFLISYMWMIWSYMQKVTNRLTIFLKLQALFWIFFLKHVKSLTSNREKTINRPTKLPNGVITRATGTGESSSRLDCSNINSSSH